MGENLSNIYYITLIPRSQYMISYYINNNKELHTRSLTDMEKYLQTLIPVNQFQYLNELLYSFIPFFIDLQEKKIYELEVDNLKEFNEMRERMKANEIERVKNYINSNKENNKKQQLKDISQAKDILPKNLTIF